MKVDIINRQSELSINSNEVARVVQTVLQFEQCSCDEVVIIFVDAKTISGLHQQFFDDPSPTDCITFPMDRRKEGGYHLLGEVFVCPKVAIDYANQYCCDPYDEVTLYIVHGLLHLLGYDDITATDRHVIASAERRNLRNLKELGCRLESKG